MNGTAVVNSFKKRFGNKIRGARVEKHVHRVKNKCNLERVWLEVESSAFKEAVLHLCELSRAPHFAVCSGYQQGSSIALNYHFSINYAKKLSELSVTIQVQLPKEKAELPTITDLVPGALISEREMQEMLGVKIGGIPDSRRLFLDKGFPKGVFPWRRDETGPEKLARNLHKGGKR